ncbi:TlpA disulfide reductase family protein [Tenacibaculum tangerinum]|uniref:TlpA disulfide reductase family protein n=1 Tax=Tenacibaculum tangerinum TaxID=3038772 RepID=A0ABY8L3M7_9FLAO|nr:TlpA disulfide reductase family protein [Tenacibaculum tangerinum]WGH75691.1 TlpA disulfide reductase family protein [Tenacibaculum tangerinum]
MKTNIQLFFISLFCFFLELILAFLTNGNVIYRFIFFNLIYFLISFIVFKKFPNIKLKVLFFFLVPVLFVLVVSLYAYYQQGFNNLLPAVLFGILSLVMAFYLSERKTIILPIGVYLITLLLGWYMYTNWILGWSEKIENEYLAEEVVIKDANGEEFHIKDKKGTVTVLDLWSTTCGACIKKFPDFEKQYNLYKNDSTVKLYSLYLPLKRDTALSIKSYTSNYTFPKLYAENISSWEKLNIDGVPLIIMIDKKGKVRFRGAMNTNKYLLYNNFNRLIEKFKNE